MSIKEKILVCYDNVTTASIHKILGCNRSYVHKILETCDLPVRKAHYDFWRKFYGL